MPTHTDLSDYQEAPAAAFPAEIFLLRPLTSAGMCGSSRAVGLASVPCNDQACTVPCVSACGSLAASLSLLNFHNFFPCRNSLCYLPQAVLKSIRPNIQSRPQTSESVIEVFYTPTLVKQKMQRMEAGLGQTPSEEPGFDVAQDQILLPNPPK